MMSEDNSIGGRGNSQFGKQVKDNYLWWLTVLVLLITLFTSIYLFQPYIRQYPNSYLTIYAVLTSTFLLLLAPVVYVLAFRKIHTGYLLIYIVAMLFLIGFSIDMAPLFYIPWALELIFLFISKKDTEKFTKL